MASQLIYDIKGKVNGVEKSYNDMSHDEIRELMKTERFSLTCAPGGENNRGMEIIGRMPIKGEGFTANDIEGLGIYFNESMYQDCESSQNVNVLNLNTMSSQDNIMALPNEDQARVLILRDWASKFMGSDDWTIEVFKELASKRWDAEYLDPNKYRKEIQDGKEVKILGRKMNKKARTNLCFVADKEQEPAVYEGKGTIYDLKKMEYLHNGVTQLKQQIAAGLIDIDSKTKVEINVVEGNRYYNLKNTGIGFHGDTERVVVICISIGCDNYPMRWQWFNDGMPVGDSIDIRLNCGDVYIMSEKAVGADWKLKGKYTLRHSAGSEKYTSLSKWEKKMPTYQQKLKVKKEKKAQLLKERQAKKEAKRLAKEERLKLEQEERQAKKEAKRLAKEERLKMKEEERLSKKEEKRLAKLERLENPKPKTVNPEKVALRKYKAALRKHDWEDTDASFYAWVEIEATHDVSLNCQYFKWFRSVWNAESEDFDEKADIKQWEEQRAFYRNLRYYKQCW